MGFIAPRVGTGFASVVLAFCLFGDSPATRSGRGLALVLAETREIVSDPSTQWVAIVLGGTYLAAFIVLRRARSAPGGVGADNCGSFPTGLWLAVTAVVAATSYALHYAEAARRHRRSRCLRGPWWAKGLRF